MGLTLKSTQKCQQAYNVTACLHLQLIVMNTIPPVLRVLYWLPVNVKLQLKVLIIIDGIPHCPGPTAAGLPLLRASAAFPSLCWSRLLECATLQKGQKNGCPFKSLFSAGPLCGGMAFLRMTGKTPCYCSLRGFQNLIFRMVFFSESFWES